MRDKKKEGVRIIKRSDMLPTTTNPPNNDGRRLSKTHKVFGAILGTFCLATIFDLDSYLTSTGNGGRRSLLSNLYLQASHGTLLPWAQHQLVDVTTKPNPEEETALFWHIPKSGGTTAKRLYQCMGRTLAHRVGGDPRFGHDEDKELIVFEPFQGKDFKVANVDTTIIPGILRAEKLGLVQSHTVDLIFTMEPNFAGQHLYDENNKGRVLSLFRNPVDRAVSMFYYLQTATWERTYKPEWANMSIIEWANLPNAEEDYMVHKLVGKSFGDHVDQTDLIIAKELVRQRFIVGLMGEMEESIRRFNIVLGIDEGDERNQQCMIDYFGPKDVTPVVSDESGGDAENTKATDKSNSNKHPKVVEGSPEYAAIAMRNPMDMILYNYVVLLFEEQKSIVDSYSKDVPSEVSKLEKEILEVEKMLDVDETPQEEISFATNDPGSVNVPSVINRNLVSIDEPFKDRRSETPFFWHVPKSGGTTMQRMYWCMGFTLANEVGGNPKFGYDERSELVSFHPWKDNPGRVINVDVASLEGITAAKNKGFLQDNGGAKPDLISTSEFRFASEQLFSRSHKARMFALFRHPIERAVSKFYYLQKANWEPTFKERWGKITLEEWASRERGENNWMVRHLVGKRNNDPLNSSDLELAKEIIRSKFVVGLMEEFEESVRRFNVFMGVDESDSRNKQCIDDFSSNGGSNLTLDKGKKNEWNSYSHPEAERGSTAWVNLSKINFFDVLLYRFIIEQFEDQRALFDPIAVN